MPDTLESARRWSGYVCPDCRFVFRVPRDHDGKGIVCPSCRRMLKIPTATDTPPPLLVPLRRTAPEEPASEEHPQKHKKRRRGRRSESNHSWEKDAQSQYGSAGIGQTRLFLIGGGVLLALVVAGIAISMSGGGRAGGTQGPIAPVAAMDLTIAAKPAASAPVVPGDAAFLAKAEPLARAFLTATTVDQLLPLVRHPDITDPACGLSIRKKSRRRACRNSTPPVKWSVLEISARSP